MKNPMSQKTPEERKAIAKKGTETRRRNQQRRNQMREEAKAGVDVLKAEARRLEARISELRQLENAHLVTFEVTGKRMVEEWEIVESAKPWAENSGVYFLVKGTRVVYVGQSVNVYTRVAGHMRTKDFDSFSFVRCPKNALNQLESIYIHMLQPPQNGNAQFGDGKEKHAPLSFIDALCVGNNIYDKNGETPC